MPLVINSNTAAFDAARNLELTTNDFVQAVQRLSSGLRINTAADDPSGLAIAEGLLAQANGFQQVQSNMQDSVSMLQVAQAGLNQIQTALQRMNQLAIEASNSTETAADRQNIQLEIVGLISEIDQVAQQTQYNSTKLLNGSAGGATVAAGGPDITDVQAQAGVAQNGTYSITASLSASQSTVTGNVQSTGVMLGGGSVTIVGPTGVSATFTSFAGESASTFIEQVNDSAVGVTASINSATNKYVLTSNDYGIVGTSASNGIKNPTGPKAVQVIGSATDPDFASAGLGGADLGLVGGTSNSPNNAAVTIGGAMVGLTGVNSDQFNGTSATAGLSFRVINPGAIGTGDQITVTQNGALQLQTGPDAGDQAPFSIDAQNALALGVNALDLTSVSGAQQAITDTQTALAQIATVQTNLGALQSTLIDNETAAGAFQVDALQAHSNLVDANIAQETIRFARDQILMESGAAVIAQANQVPGNLFALLLPSIKG